MKLVITLCAVTGLLAGCFPTRTQDLQCVQSNECDTGRTCVQGYCVFTGGGDIDAAPMVEIDAPPASACEMWGETSLFNPCEIPDHDDIEVNLADPGAYTFDTTSGALTGPAGAIPVNTALQTSSNIRIMSVKSFTVGPSATLRVIGSSPALIASWTTISVNGVIDASSTDTVSGAGASAAGANGCVAGTPPTADPDNGDGDGGGGGGGGATAGGPGGQGGADGNDGAAGGAGQARATVPTFAGGCPGANGIQENAGGGFGVGGAGGGAIWLTAKNMINIQGGGVINAGGGGGKGATGDRAGGGGGGSGGMIGLESPTVTNAGIVAANGGSGGQGRDNGLNGTNGVAGAAGTTAAVGAAQPNLNAASGGRGGNGGAAAAAPAQGNPGNNNNGDTGGGGGGGGSVGYVVVVGPGSLSGTVSPQAISRSAP